MKSIRLVIVVMGLAVALPTAWSFSAIPDSLKNRIDSLQAVASVSQGMQKYEAEFKIAWDLFDIDNHIAVRHAGIAYEVALASNDTAKVIRSGRLYGQLLRRTDKPDQAIAVFNWVLPLAERTQANEEIGRILTALATTYNNQGNFDHALVANFKALRLRLASGDSLRAGHSYNNIGVIYYTMGDHNEASSYYEKAILMGDSVSKSQAFCNLGMAKLYLGEFHLFPDLAKQSQLYAPRWATTQQLIQYEDGFGLYFLKTGAIDSAEHYFRKSLRRNKELADSKLIFETRVALAECAVKHGMFEAATKELREVESEMAAFRFDQVRMRCYEILTSALEGSGRWKEAFKYSQKGRMLRDSLFDQRIQTRMAVARVEFEERDNQLSISKQAHIIELNNKVIDQQGWLILISVSLAIVFAGFVVVLYRFNRYEKSVSLQLDKKVFERTHELKSSEDALAKALAEQTALMQLVSRKVKASMATFRGLWNIGAVESLGANTMNDRFEATANELLQLSSIVDRSQDLRTRSVARNNNIPDKEYSLELFAEVSGKSTLTNGSL